MTIEERIKRAKEIRKSAMFSVSELEDRDASEVVTLYPTMAYKSKLITAGTRINFNGRLFKATADLWDTEGNNPDNAPSLWEEILYKDGYRIIPETITVGTAFAKDECGYWNEVLYKSLIDANVWNPEQNPSGWEIV